MSQSRLTALDGLRGLAAITVFFSHAVGMIEDSKIPYLWRFTVLHSVWDGAAAVDLFFVLSGFCLALPYVIADQRRLDVPDFTVRRIFRIYPTYLVGLLVSLALRFLVFEPGGLNGLSSWVTALWRTVPTAHDLLAHVAFVGVSFDTRLIDPVIWTLVVEMRMALIFPLVLMLLHFRRTLWTAATLLVGSYALAMNVKALEFLPLFVLGALFAQWHQSLLPILRRMTALPVTGLIIITIVLYSVRFSLPGWHPQGDELLTHGLVAVGSVALIGLALAIPAVARPLSSRVAVFLGDISYSFYLLHLPVLLAVSSLLFPRIPSLPVVWLASLVTSVALAYVFMAWVETPSIRLGKALCRTFANARVRGRFTAG